MKLLKYVALIILCIPCYTSGVEMTFTLSSTDFTDNSAIPANFTCQGEDIVPTLTWQGAPDNTKTYALIMDDPDAPHGTWVHWVLFNIPATVSKLSNETAVPTGAVNATNTWGNVGYGGPCPPSGTHRYFFKLYALDTSLALNADATKSDVENAMQGHILATAQLMGLYSKS